MYALFCVKAATRPRLGFRSSAKVVLAQTALLSLLSCSCKKISALLPSRFRTTWSKQRCEISSGVFHFSIPASREQFFLLTLQKRGLKKKKKKPKKKHTPFSPLSYDWWMLTGKTLWQAEWLNQLQQAYHTLSVMEQPRADTLIEIQTESTMTNRLPISSSVCREPSTRSEGCSGTSWDPLNHVRWSFSRNADACSFFSLPYDVPWGVRKQQHFS